MDDKGNVYFLEMDKHFVRKLSADGTLTTLAGSEKEGFRDGKGAEAQFKSPYDLAVSSKGEVFVSDTGNHRVRRIAADGTVTTVIGNGADKTLPGELLNAQIGNPRGIDFGTDGILYLLADGKLFRARLE